MILFPFCIHNILSTLSGAHFSFNASLTCLGTAAVPSLLRRVFMKLDWGVPLVTMISSPSCVHSSFVNFPGGEPQFQQLPNPFWNGRPFAPAEDCCLEKYFVRQVSVYAT